MYLMRIKYRIGCRLTHTVTHTPKWPERTKEYRTGRSAFPSGFCGYSNGYITCPRTLPIVWAASSCFCRVAWV